MLSSFMARAKIRNWTRDRKVPGPMGLAAIGAAALFALFQLSGHNYLLFHTLVELWALAQLAEKLHISSASEMIQFAVEWTRRNCS
jgi:hypothetical protein